MCYFRDLIEDSADKVLLHPIDDHATLAQQKFVAFENNIIVGPHTEIILVFQFISIYKYLKSFHANSNHRVYIDCESKYFFCISIVFWCVYSRRPFSTMPADQQSSYKNSDW